MLVDLCRREQGPSTKSLRNLKSRMPLELLAVEIGNFEKFESVASIFFLFGFLLNLLCEPCFRYFRFCRIFCQHLLVNLWCIFFSSIVSLFLVVILWIGIALWLLVSTGCFAVFVVCYNVTAVVALVIFSIFCTCGCLVVDYNGVWVAELLILVNIYQVSY